MTSIKLREQDDYHYVCSNCGSECNLLNFCYFSMKCLIDEAIEAGTAVQPNYLTPTLLMGTLPGDASKAN